MNNIQLLEQLTEAAEQAGANLAPTYQEYMPMAFAVANSCGEAGRPYFHRLCRLSGKYRADDADRLFTHALRSGKGGNSLGTVFHLAELAGVSLPRLAPIAPPKPQTGTTGTVGTASLSPHTHVRTREEEEENTATATDDADDTPDETVEGSEPMHGLPVFPQADWPEPLKTILAYAENPHRRDVMLLGAVTVLGASMGNTVHFLYGEKRKSPCLQTFVVAPPVSGKGVLTHVRQLVKPIHDDIRRQVAAQMNEYRRQKAAYDALGKERATAETPQPPANRMFFLSGNNTNTGLLQNLMDSDATGLIFETEADTISTAIGTDYGHWSDTLRKAFDHDPLSYNRRTDREYREVPQCFLSMLISGTPAQVKPLIPSAENGLFSRQLFYYMPAVRRWVSQFSPRDTSLDDIFARLGERWKQDCAWLKRQGTLNVRLSEEQQHEFDRAFTGLFHRSHVTNGDEMTGTVVRLAVNLFRILSVVAVLRALEPLPAPEGRPDGFPPASGVTPAADIAADNLKDGIVTRWDVQVTQADFRAVLSLLEALYCHATHILSFLPSSELKRRTNADRDALFASLPREFTRREMLEIAESLNVKPVTAITWLKRLVKKEVIEHTDKKGGYRIIPPAI